jgi:hypothetical protein
MIFTLLACLALQEPPEGANPAGPWVSVATASYDDVCGVNTVGVLGCTRTNSASVFWPGRGREFVTIDGGMTGWCAIDTEGELLCSAGLEPPAGPFEHITMGYDSACARDEWGNATCFGGGNNGDRLTDVPGSPVRSISLGYDYGVAVNTDGAIIRWGRTPAAGLVLPVNNAGFTGVASDFGSFVAAGPSESVLIEYDETFFPGGGSIQGDSGTYCVMVGGRASCFGDNNDRQAEPPAETFSELDVGNGFACGVTEEQRIACWGDSDPYPFE